MREPAYIKAFREAVKKLEREKSEISEISTPINSLNSLISHAPASGMVCAQCGGGLSTNPATDAPTIPVTTKTGEVLWLHPECRRFWLAEQSGIAHRTVH